MAPSASRGASVASEDGATRQRILDAAAQCFRHVGIAKSTMHDVARVADLSRGTVYRYFPDRRSLVDATVNQYAQRYYDEAAQAMEPFTTLSARVGAFGEVFARTFTGHRDGRLVSDDMHLARIMAADVDGALRRMTTFLRPYVRDA